MKRKIAVLVSTTLVMVSASITLGQYRVDTSKALENNLRVGSGGVNPRGPKRDYTGRFNDALVTGNAGGMSRFRGTIGYRASGEFRGAGGTVNSSSFKFRQQNLTSGNSGNPQVNQRGGNILYRSGSGVTSGQLRNSTQSQFGTVHKRILRDDVISGSVIQGRLNTESLDLQAARPRIQTPEIYNTDTGALLRVNASPLTGLQTSRLGDPLNSTINPYAPVKQNDDETPPVKPIGTVEQEKAQLRERDKPEPANPLQLNDRVVDSSRYLSDFLNRNQTDRIDDGKMNNLQTDANILTASVLYPSAFDKVEPGEDAYLDHLNRIRGDDDPGDAALNDAISRRNVNERWVGSLTGITPDQEKKESYLDKLKRKLAEMEAESLEKSKNQAADERENDVAFEKLIEKLDYDLAPIPTLAGSSKSEFDAAMREAEVEMSEGKYFEASAVYQQAARFRPGHPSVLVGRINAQIGAGLIGSASIDLHRLLSSHPELIAARYAEPILPQAKRLVEVRGRLLQLLSVETPQVSVFLLAYIAYQQGDDIMLDNALTALAAWYPDDSLIPLLERIWLPQTFEKQ